jgi:23S rRNA (pseudouridine1915-N3)-methyltransferase
MKIHLIAVGQKPPKWVVDGYETYAKRMPAQTALQLKELAPGPRKKQDVGREAAVAAVRKETADIKAAIPKGALVVALDERGKSWSTRQLAQQLDAWRNSGKDVALLVGGPDGLAEELRQQADQQWCLSPLTLPHAMVRVLVAEQLYRAHSILHNHPYHRD